MFEIGASLREARARRQLGYDQIEAETKIRAKYIRCMEDEQFDVLPSGTYVRGFLRTYADYLGLDGQLYVDEYSSRFGDIPDERTMRRRERPQQRRNESSNAVLIALAGIVAVGVLLLAAWKLNPSTDRPAAPLPPATPTTTSGLDEPGEPVELPGPEATARRTGEEEGSHEPHARGEAGLAARSTSRPATSPGSWCGVSPTRRRSSTRTR